MASTTESVTVIKRSFVSPPPSGVAAAGMSLPLTHMDMVWLHFFPTERLMFYEIPQLSRDHFIDHFVPELEHSLSLVLEHFSPLAGNLIIPSDSSSSSSLPEIRYVQGDSVTVTFAECDKIDLFGYLTADDARNCREFHSFVPELFKPAFLDDDSDSASAERRIPVLRIQVTLFPKFGISLGISNHHAVGDASALFHFMKTWASFHSQLLKKNTDAVSCAKSIVIDSPPFYDRTIIKDPKGLASIFFERMNRLLKFVKNDSSFQLDSFFEKININVRKTFVITRKDVEKLKSLAMKNSDKVLHLSSFTVACAYVWTCLVKSEAPSGEEVSDEELEQFSFFAECRSRLDPPLPENYFGNCLINCETTSEHGKLVGEEGFQIAAGLIGKTIHELLSKSSAELFSGAEKWMEGPPPEGGKWRRAVGVAGSPKYNYYNLDFGWGKPRKFEFVSIDITGAISLSGCREPDGAIEVGLSLSKPKLDALTVIFRDGLDAL